MNNNIPYIPDPVADLSRFGDLLRRNIPFCFIRFSDGEIEILRNRYLEISTEQVVFRGNSSASVYPAYDSKLFDPKINKNLRRDLLASAMLSKDNYFKGVPTYHNSAVIDREFMVRLNGGMSEYMTFSDLLMNSNYIQFRNSILPILSSKSLYVIANYRAVLRGELRNAKQIAVSDNIFGNYEQCLSDALLELEKAPLGAVILSSASSLSNILGMKIFERRPDITFLDIGTSLNDLFSLDSRSRRYHVLLENTTFATFYKKMRYMKSKQYKMVW